MIARIRASHRLGPTSVLQAFLSEIKFSTGIYDIFGYLKFIRVNMILYCWYVKLILALISRSFFEHIALQVSILKINCVIHDMVRVQLKMYN